MKTLRWTFLAVLALALGAATALVLAWGVAGWRAPINSFGGELVAADPRPAKYLVAGSSPEYPAAGWDFGEERRFGECVFYMVSGLRFKVPERFEHSRPSLGADIDAFFEHHWLDDPGARGYFQDTYFRGVNIWFVARTYGWPLPCLWYGTVGNTLGSAGWTVDGYGAVRFGRAIGMIHPLPTRPLWGGLIVDTLVLGAAWWVLLSVPPWVRRAMQRRDGHCVKCGYDLGGLAPGAACPECGASR